MSNQNFDYGLKELQAKNILLEFTKELIRNSGGDIFKLKNIVEEEVKEKRKTKNPAVLQQRKSINNQEEKKDENSFGGYQKSISVRKTSGLGEDPLKRAVANMSLSRPKPIELKKTSYTLSIPKPVLPAIFRYLQPTPTDMKIELGKIDSLIKDPLVSLIESSGPGQRVYVDGSMGRKQTNIFLSKEEIDGIIKKFSEETKIPIHEGVFRVVAGKLIFTAIVSSVVGSKFVIKKMIYRM